MISSTSIGAGLAAQSVDRQRPGPGLQLPGIAGRIFLVDAELVEIVVARDRIERCPRLLGRVSAFRDGIEPGRRHTVGRSRRDDVGEGCGHAGHGRRGEKASAVEVNTAWRDLGGSALAGIANLDQHR